MNNNISVEQLRRNGFKVRVSHKRITEEDPVAQYRETKKEKILPCGGETVVEIVHESTNKSYLGVAQCSLKDNYSKKVGVRIATERALLQALRDNIQGQQIVTPKKKAVKK